MALIVGNAPGNDFCLAEDKVKDYRNFANKIWNATRFILSFEGQKKTNKRTHQDDLWILKETEKLTKQVTGYINRYRFDLAAEILYQFFWHTFCDQYLEMAKKRREEAQSVLLGVLATNLKLLHPFMPFLTEEVWQIVKKQTNHPDFQEEALITTPWPKN